MVEASLEELMAGKAAVIPDQICCAQALQTLLEPSRSQYGVAGAGNTRPGMPMKAVASPKQVLSTQQLYSNLKMAH